jgi:microcystin-dependent protein
MPSHNHTFSGSNTHSHDYKGTRSDDGDDDGYRAAVNRNDGNANHIRPASAQDGVQNATITISGDTGNKGSGSSHENRPPYYALAFIIKT